MLELFFCNDFTGTATLGSAQVAARHHHSQNDALAGRIHFPPAVGLRVEYNPAQLAPRVETTHLDDERLIKSWGTNLYRLTFDLTKPALEGEVAVRVVPAVSAR